MATPTLDYRLTFRMRMWNTFDRGRRHVRMLGTLRVSNHL